MPCTDAFICEDVLYLAFNFPLKPGKLRTYRNDEVSLWMEAFINSRKCLVEN